MQSCRKLRNSILKMEQNTQNRIKSEKSHKKGENIMERQMNQDQNTTKSKQNLKNKSVSSDKKQKKSLIDWTPEEDRILFEEYACQGSKWVEIAKILPNKNDNDIKNRFYSRIRRVTKIINQYQHRIKSSHKKLINFNLLLTVLEMGKFNQKGIEGKFIEIQKKSQEIKNISNQIISLAFKQPFQIKDEFIQSLVSKLVTLRPSLKFINGNRVKKSVTKSSKIKNVVLTQNLQNFDKVLHENDHTMEQMSRKLEKQKHLIIEQNDEYIIDEVKKYIIPDVQYINLIQSFEQILDSSLIQGQRRDDLLSIL